MDRSFHTLKVKAVEQLTPEAVAIELEVPPEWQETYTFKAGQYLTFRIYIDGEEVRRTYSICSAPHENKWVVGVKHLPGGLFSTYANQQLKPGDTIEVMPPLGRFTLPEPAAEPRNYVAFAAGSGITPVLSLIKQALKEEPHSRFTLFFGNKLSATIMFRREINALKNRYMDRLQVHHILSREMLESDLFCGRLGGEKCRLYNGLLFDSNKTDHYYICGPEPMILEVRDTLVNMGVPRETVHVELFTAAGSRQADRASSRKTEYGDATAEVTLKLDGRTIQFPLTYDGQSILDTALKYGADLPYACKGGVCSTCMARLTEGEVEMDVNYALEPDEIAKRLILTCQSHPRSEKLVVDFDDI